MFSKHSIEIIKEPELIASKLLTRFLITKMVGYSKINAKQTQFKAQFSGRTKIDPSKLQHKAVTY